MPVGGWLVVEDGCVDVEALRLDESWPRGVLTLVEEWMATPAAAGFVRRRDAELYAMTSHPGGFRSACARRRARFRPARR